MMSNKVPLVFPERPERPEVPVRRRDNPNPVQLRLR